MAQQNVGNGTHGYKFFNWGAALLCLIVGYGVYLRCLGFFEPWSDDLLGYAGSYNSLSARNYLRYGLANLKLTQYWEGGPIGPSSFVYASHPPLIPILVFLSFKLFHTYSEWSARLVPIFFSIASLFVLYSLVKKVWTRQTALLACFIAAVVPMATYYGQMVCYETTSIFSFLLVLYFYLEYLERPRALSLTYMVLSLLVGALDDWPIFYAVPLLCAHYLFLAKEKKKSFLIFPISAGLIFLLVVMLALRVGPSYILESLYFYIANPTMYGVWSQSMTLTEWCRTVFSYHVELYTLPVLILSLVWLIGLIFRLARRENLTKDVLVGILLLFGLLNIGLGWQRAGDPAHAFWASLSIPGLAVASALVLHDIYERFVARSGKSFYLKSFYLKGLFYMLLLVFAFYCTEKLYSLAIRSDSYYKLGMVINRNSTFDDLILMPYDSIQPTLKFYADRNLRDDVYDLADFYRLCYEDPQAGKLRYAVMTQTDAVEYPELYRFLDLAFDHKTDEDYVIFDLKSKKLSDEDIIKYLTLRKEQYNFWTATRKSDYEAAAVAGNFQHIQLTVGGETRRALALAPNSKVTFQPVSVLEGARLKFGVGVSDSYQAEAGAATKFEIIVHSENQDHVLFSKLMDPTGNPGDTSWHDDVIDLSPFAGRELGITLSIEQASGTVLNTAGWADLEIVYE